MLTSLGIVIPQSPPSCRFKSRRDRREVVIVPPGSSKCLMGLIYTHLLRATLHKERKLLSRMVVRWFQLFPTFPSIFGAWLSTSTFGAWLSTKTGPNLLKVCQRRERGLWYLWPAAWSAIHATEIPPVVKPGQHERRKYNVWTMWTKVSWLEGKTWE